MTRLAVIGGSGFIGKHLVNRLATAGHHVRALGRSNSGGMAPLSGDREVEWLWGDFQNEALLRRAMEGAETVFQLVSTTLPRSSNDDPVYDLVSNVCGSLKLLLTVVECGVRKVVFLSSGGTIYGTPSILPIPEDHPLEPNCSYGIGKLAIEKYLKLFRALHGLDFAIVRLSNPFGEGQPLDRGQGAVSIFLNRVLHDAPIEIWGDGSAVRDYVYISDAIEGIVAAADREDGSRIYNIGSGIGHSLNEVIAEIEQVVGKRATVHYKGARTFDVPANVLCIDRARTELNYSPKVSFRDGICKTVEWLLR